MAATERHDRAGAIIAAALALPGVAAQAESAPENGVVALRYLSYQDRQPGLDRIRVNAPSVYVLAPLAPQWTIDASAVADSVSGASPRYHTAISGATPHMTDQRYAGTVQVTRYLDRANVSVGLATSRGNDYDSNAGSINANFSSDDNNRTWNIGLGYASDRIGSTNDPTLHETRRTAELLGAVVEQEPRFHIKCRLTPRKFEHGRNQTYKKSAVADDGNTFFRLAILVAVTCDQVGKYLVCAELALFIAFKSAIPPT